MLINEMKNYHSQFPVGQNVNFLLDDDSEIDFQIQTDSDSQKTYSWSNETDKTWMDFGTFDWNGDVQNVDLGFWTHSQNQCWDSYGWSDKDLEDLLLERRDLEGLLEGRLELLFEWSERVLLLALLLDRRRVVFLGRVILLYTCQRRKIFL